jgi:hypothetical protein
MERDVFQVTWNIKCCHQVKHTYSNIVTDKCCMNGTVSNSECERVSDTMMVVVNKDEIVE